MNCTLITNTNSANTSGPTIVMDAGMGNWSLFFRPLAAQLSGFANVLLIDRTGYTDKAQVNAESYAQLYAHDLKLLLISEKITGPIVLVGHSLGGLNVRMFHYLFPRQVAGLILLDSPHHDLLNRIPEIRSDLKKQLVFTKCLSLLARTGLLRLLRNRIPLFNLPKELHSDYYAVTTRSTYYKTYYNELKSLENYLKRCAQLPGIGSTPLLVISSCTGLKPKSGEVTAARSAYDKKWYSMQKDLCNLSDDSVFAISHGDHFLHLTDTRFVARCIQSFYTDHLTKPTYISNKAS